MTTTNKGIHRNGLADSKPSPDIIGIINGLMVVINTPTPVRVLGTDNAFSEIAPAELLGGDV